MQFEADCADIPEELIADQQRGEVVFLCGAGVSQRVGLPSFYKLVTDIYAALHQEWHGHPAEEASMEPAFGRAVALDRAIFSLRMRLGGGDRAATARVDREVVSAVEASLAPPQGALTDHLNILRLSTDAELRPRIVTTNFDTLFERAWIDRWGKPLSSWASADLPAPLSADFEGVLHIHGRISDKRLGLARTNLVLDSAEFGEAYLRSGWAARYIYDLARAATIVVVGYGADDPPMRYILEVLVADRARFSDLRPIYAFAPSPPDPAERARQSALWKAKGALAILYESAGDADHDALYRTIAAWADYAENTLEWKRRHIKRIFAAEPDEIGEADWARLGWLLRNGDASQTLADVNPAPHWGPALARRGWLNGENASPAKWIVKRLADEAMIGAVLDGVPLDVKTRHFIQRALDRREDTLPERFALAWQLLVEASDRKQQHLGSEWFSTLRAIKAGDVSLRVRRQVIKCLRPYAHARRPFRWPNIGASVDAAPRLRDLISVNFSPLSYSEPDKLVELWPAAHRRALVGALTSALEEALEEASEYELIHIGYDAASADVRSVAPHPQDAHPRGFYPIVRTIVDLWELLAQQDRDAARAVARAWAHSPFLLVRRLWLHCLSVSAAFSGGEALEGLLAASDHEFWLADSQRETMRLMATRWPDFPSPDVERLEERIIGGVPRELLRKDAPEEQITAVIESAIYRRGMRIARAGHGLSTQMKSRLNGIIARHPEWEPGEGDRDDFRIWSGGTLVGPRGNVELLRGVRLEELVTRAFEAARRDPLNQGEVWRLFCSAEPKVALDGLIADLDQGRINTEAWQEFFWALVEDDTSSLHMAVLDVVGREEFPVGDLVHPILDWLSRSLAILSEWSDRVLGIWDRVAGHLAAVAREVSDSMRHDPVFGGLSEAEGKLGQLLIWLLRRRNPEPKSGLPTDVRERLEWLIARSGALGYLGRVAVADEIVYLTAFDREWVLRKLVPWFDWSHRDDTAALWAALFQNDIVPPELYSLLKPSLFRYAREMPLAADRPDMVVRWLLQPLIWNQDPNSRRYDVETNEVRRTLAEGGPELRQQSADWLYRAQRYDLDGDRAVIWRDCLSPLLRYAWPTDASLRDPTTSKALGALAAATGSAFPEAVETIVPLLVPFEQADLSTALDLDPDDWQLLETFPDATLGLLNAVVSADHPPADLGVLLERLAAKHPDLVADRRLLKLRGWAQRRSASL